MVIVKVSEFLHVQGFVLPVFNIFLNLKLNIIGYYCPEGSNSSTMYPCPAGYFGVHTGLTSAFCNGLCIPGYYCPVATTNPGFTRISIMFLIILHSLSCWNLWKHTRTLFIQLFRVM